jgi:uncharacterized protein YcfL
MKLMIPLLAIPVLSAFLLVGCNQNTPSTSTDAQATNASMADTNSVTIATNMPGTNSLPAMNTNTSSSTNQ